MNPHLMPGIAYLIGVLAVAVLLAVASTRALGPERWPLFPAGGVFWTTIAIGLLIGALLVLPN